MIYNGQFKREKKKNCSHRDFQSQQPGQIITARDGSVAGMAKDSQHLTLFWRSLWGRNLNPTWSGDSVGGGGWEG